MENQDYCVTLFADLFLFKQKFDTFLQLKKITLKEKYIFFSPDWYIFLLDLKFLNVYFFNEQEKYKKTIS